MWDRKAAFDKVLLTVNMLNRFQWNHTYIFNGIKKHHPQLYDKVTQAQNEVDAAFTSRDEERLDKALRGFEGAISEVWIIYTGKIPNLKVNR